MKVIDLTTETIETFNWLESESGFAREGPQIYLAYHAERIIYKKNDITMTVVCDNREDYLFFEIFVAENESKLSITDSESTAHFFKTMVYDKIGLVNVRYKSVFDYTQDSYSEKQFECLRGEAELQLKKRGGRKRYVEVFSQLIKVALPAIEAATNSENRI
jgi:hypothetical protein